MHVSQGLRHAVGQGTIHGKPDENVDPNEARQNTIQWATLGQGLAAGVFERAQ